MAVKITTTRTGSRDLESVAKKMANPKPYLEMVGEAFLARAKQRIRTLKKGPDGERWAPWATSTAKARRAEGSASKGLLYRTGMLHENLAYRVQGQKVSITDASPYGRFLQNGTDKMPARPFLGVGEWEEKQAESLWNKYLKEK